MSEEAGTKLAWKATPEVRQTGWYWVQWADEEGGAVEVCRVRECSWRGPVAVELMAGYCRYIIDDRDRFAGPIEPPPTD